MYLIIIFFLVGSVRSHFNLSTSPYTCSGSHAYEELCSQRSISIRNPLVEFDCKSNLTRLDWCSRNTLLRSNERLLESLRNKKIVFMGDSLTRYQYLTLVYFLTHEVYLLIQVSSLYTALLI